jgi:hypothetical protein
MSTQGYITCINDQLQGVHTVILGVSRVKLGVLWLNLGVLRHRDFVNYY